MKEPLRKDSAAYAGLKTLFLITSCFKTDLSLYLSSTFSTRASSVGISKLIELGFAIEEKDDDPRSGSKRQIITITKKGKIYFVDSTYETDLYYSDYMNEYGKDYATYKSRKSLNSFYRNKRVELIMKAAGVNVFPDDKPTLDQLYHILLPKDDPDFNVFMPADTSKQYPFYNMVQSDDIGIQEVRKRFQNEGFFYTLSEVREFMRGLGVGDVDALKGCTATGVYFSQDKILVIYRQNNESSSYNRLSGSDAKLPAILAGIFARISSFNRSIPAAGIGTGTIDAMVITNGSSSVYSMVMGAKSGTRSPLQEKRRKANQERFERFERIEDTTKYVIRIRGMDSSHKAELVEAALRQVPGVTSVSAVAGSSSASFTCPSVYNLNRKAVRNALALVEGIQYLGFKSEGSHSAIFLNYSCSIFPRIFAVPFSLLGIRMIKYILHTTAEEWREDGIRLARSYALNVAGADGFSLDVARDVNKAYVGVGRREINVASQSGVKRFEIPIRAIWLPFYEVRMLRAMSVDGLAVPDGIPSFAYGVMCYPGMEDCLAHCLRRATWYFRVVEQGDRVINADGSEKKAVNGEYMTYDHEQIVPLSGFVIQFDANGFRVDVEDKRREKAMSKPRRRYKKHLLTIDFGESGVQTIRQLSKATGRSMGYLIRHVMYDWMKSDECQRILNGGQLPDYLRETDTVDQADNGNDESDSSDEEEGEEFLELIDD